MNTSTQIHPDYLALIRHFPLRPIRTRQDHDRAMVLIRELAPVDEGTLSTGKQDYLDALTLLLENYDHQDEYDAPGIGGLDVLRALMEANEMNVSDLGKVIGSQPNASLIVSGKRQMSKAVMVKLGKRFGVDPGLFLR